MTTVIDFESSNELLKLLLDNVPQEIVVIDCQGFIQFANKSWHSYGEEHHCLVDSWLGINYLAECKKAAARGDEFGIAASDGIKAVIEGQRESFSFEYPCECPEKTFWFTMHVTPISLKDDNFYIISHYDITDRKSAEEEVLRLSRLDPLTAIPNRRNIDEFLQAEWRRCAREETLLSYALIDIDYFKAINDTYGHQVGDQCLVKLANVLREISSRPSDLCGRYGGEEFVVIWSGVPLMQTQLLIQKLLTKVDQLHIPNECSPKHKQLTVSVGLASMIPKPDVDATTLVKRADQLLYSAKEGGRNKVASKFFQSERLCEA